MFFLVLLLPTLAYIPVLTNMTWSPLAFGLDPWPVVTTYLGLILAGAMFLAIGLLVSSLVKSQLVSALLTLIVSLAFVTAAFVRPSYDTVSLAKQLVYFISVPEHFRLTWCRGVIDSRHAILYVTVTLFCLFLTVRSLEARRR
jgi:ABC-type transport system involved in multi-copper enzyme maturation permease subunit